ncbi:HlyD family efflux transporter periplasmic adaptor subunit [Methyloraptor flagellatus]|uniref:HlyD family efflux transporter periplasmic adaptor subunit n=1 Tax=Methyloraptor flagellatus TaxID=3162530 RepID=A0AAU7XHK0_9HYPH
MVETRLIRMREGARATVSLDAKTTLDGTVRQVLPEVDRTTRLGKVRIALPADPRLRIGAFARGSVELARRSGVAVPLAAVQFTANGPVVQVIVDGKVQARSVETGLTSQGLVEIVKGVTAGEKVVARAGGFLRDGDAVTAIEAKATEGQTKSEGAVR